MMLLSLLKSRKPIGSGVIDVAERDAAVSPPQGATLHQWVTTRRKPVGGRIGTLGILL